MACKFDLTVDIDNKEIFETWC